MLETIRNAFKTKEIRNKLLFVFLGLIIVRIGCNIPLPGVNTNVIQNLFDNNQALNFLDVMTGGSFTRMSIFALNITPYITASIIVQLLTIAIPRLEELQKDGEDGRKKINEYTRYLSIVLALIEGLAIVIGFRNQGFFTESGYTSVIISVVALTAGAAFLMWLGEEITEKGIGNGISIILLINIVARIPSDLISLYNQFIKSAANVTNRMASGWREKNPCTVCKENAGTENVWRSVQPYSVESKYSRRYPGYLCKFYVTASSCHCQFCGCETGIRRRSILDPEIPQGLQSERLV